jgi:hypothetical protein
VALVHKFLFLGEMSKFYFFYQIELLKENEKKNLKQFGNILEYYFS